MKYRRSKEERLVSKDRFEQFKYQNRRLQKIAQNDKKIEYFDAKYSTIVSIVERELQKRNIDLDDPTSASNVEQILKMVLSNKAFEKFKDDNITDIKNALSRKINSQKIIMLDEGPEI